MVLKKVRARGVSWAWWCLFAALLPLLPLRSLCSSRARGPAGEELELWLLAGAASLEALESLWEAGRSLRSRGYPGPRLDLPLGQFLRPPRLSKLTQSRRPHRTHGVLHTSHM